MLLLLNLLHTHPHDSYVYQKLNPTFLGVTPASVIGYCSYGKAIVVFLRASDTGDISSSSVKHWSD